MQELEKVESVKVVDNANRVVSPSLTCTTWCTTKPILRAMAYHSAHICSLVQSSTAKQTDTLQERFCSINRVDQNISDEQKEAEKEFTQYSNPQLGLHKKRSSTSVRSSLLGALIQVVQETCPGRGGGGTELGSVESLYSEC